MREENAGLPCCPVCKGEMTLKVVKSSGDEITEGILTCEGGNNRYFIRNGTAYLVPEGRAREAASPVHINREPEEKKRT